MAAFCNPHASRHCGDRKARLVVTREFNSYKRLAKASVLTLTFKLSTIKVTGQYSAVRTYIYISSGLTSQVTRKALTEGNTDYFAAGATYLQFTRQVCFSSTLPPFSRKRNIFLP